MKNEENECMEMKGNWRNNAIMKKMVSERIWSEMIKHNEIERREKQMKNEW